MLNIPYLGNFSGAFFLEKVDYLMTVFIGIVLVLLPLFILTFYGYNFHKLDDKHFRNTYGSIYDGYKPNLKVSPFFAILFILRRMLFAATCLHLRNSVWLQMLITIYIGTFQACLLLHFKPYTEPLILRLEVFNEVTNLLLFLHAYMLTDLTVISEVDNLREVHRYVSLYFGKIIVWNLLVHLFFLLRSVIKRAILYCKYRAALTNRTKIIQKEKEVSDLPRHEVYKVSEKEVSKELSSEWEYYSEDGEEDIEN
jgi:hypothetical protein